MSQLKNNLKNQKSKGLMGWRLLRQRSSPPGGSVSPQKTAYMASWLATDRQTDSHTVYGLNRYCSDRCQASKVT